MLPENSLCSYAAAFAPGLVDPSIEAPDGVVAAPGKRVVKRYNIYRNNVTVSLIDALVAIYPAVQRITGIDFFRAMARFHIRESPPVSPLLFEYGREFPAFIESYEYAKEIPWLADVARIERAWLDAYHAPDLPSFTFASLGQLNTASLADLRLRPHPAARIVRSSFPAVSIFAMNRADDPVSLLRSNEAEDALVTRPDQDVVVSHLPVGGARFLESLFGGVALGEAASIALESTAAFDLQANLAGMISAGAFIEI
jgi:hypothetical protein